MKAIPPSHGGSNYPLAIFDVTSCVLKAPQAPNQSLPQPQPHHTLNRHILLLVVDKELSVMRAIFHLPLTPPPLHEPWSVPCTNKCLIVWFPIFQSVVFFSLSKRLKTDPCREQLWLSQEKSKIKCLLQQDLP